MKDKMKDIEKLRLAADYLREQPKVEYNPWPVYPALIYDALRTLEDLNYSENYDKLQGTAIETMTLEQIATMYTFILRGERFCDGHIASYIEDGTLYRLVLRHIELYE